MTAAFYIGLWGGFFLAGAILWIAGCKAIVSAIRDLERAVRGDSRFQ